MREFYSIETYRSSKSEYALLPFRFLRLDHDRELLVTDVGEYAIVPKGTTDALVNQRLAGVSYGEAEIVHNLNESSALGARHRIYHGA